MHPTRSAYGDLAQVAPSLDALSGDNRAANLVVIAMHAGGGLPGALLPHVFRELGWAMLTERGLEVLARYCEAEARLADRALTTTAHQRGAAIADVLYGEARS